MTANEVLPSLFLGDLADAQAVVGKPDAPLVLSLMHEAPLLPGEFVLPIWDLSRGRPFPERVAWAVSFIGRVRQGGRPLLLHCAGGIDRSPYVLAKYIQSISPGLTLDQAYDKIRAVRPQIASHHEWEI